MAKPRRVWFPLDVTFTRDERVLTAGWDAARLYLAALGHMYAARAPDGYISRLTVQTLGVPRWESMAERLVKAGLWSEPDPDRYHVTAWDEWHAESESAERTREWRARKSQRDASP